MFLKCRCRNTFSTAEHAFSLLLCVARKIPQADASDTSPAPDRAAGTASAYRARYDAHGKAAIGMMTQCLAREWVRHNIAVNAICPGYIGTEMVRAVPQEVMEKSILPQIPIGRLGEPEEIARCVVFLAADESGLITGSTLSANGGQYMI